VVIGTNPETLEQMRFREIIQISRINEMNPKDSRNLESFMDRLSRVRRCQLVPALYETADREPEVFFDLWIGKRALVVRPAWQVSLNDPCAIAIHADDNPIIPAGVDDAPILGVLERAQRRRAKKGIKLNDDL
jgi:hypothetical protein